MLIYVILAIIIFSMLLSSIEEWGVVNKYYYEISKKQESDLFSRNYYKIVFVIFITFFWFITAFRNETIGNDTMAYISIFNNFCNWSFSSSTHVEIGYQFFCSLVGIFTRDPHVFLIVHATICYVAIAVYCLKYSKNLMFSLVIIFVTCFYDFTNLLRQAFAIILVMYAYQSIKKKNHLMAFLLIVLASFFHKSALAALVLLLYKLFNFNFWFVLVFSLIVSILSYFGVFAKLLVLIAPKYAIYLTGEYIDGGIFANTFYLMRALAFYAFAYHYHNGNRKNPMLWLFVCSALIYGLAFSSTVVTRMGLYFFYPMISELPNIFENDKFKYKNWWKVIISFVLILFLIFVLKFRPEWNRMYPYYFWQ